MRQPDLRTTCIYIAVLTFLGAVGVLLALSLVFYGALPTMWITVGLLALTSFIASIIAGST